jgi:hypothetical protein
MNERILERSTVEMALEKAGVSWAYISVLKMEEARASDTSVN